MKLKSFLLGAAILTSAATAFGQENADQENTRQPFVTAKAELENMLGGRRPLSYERAIFTIENAYWQGGISESLFNATLDKHTDNIRKIIAAQNPMPDYKPTDVLELAQTSPAERKENYTNAIINGAIFQYLTDTTYIISKGKFSYHLPYGYSYGDPMGSNDWANTQVTHLLNSKNGNCFALASLYKIFAERLHSKANLCTAPGHIYIRHSDDKGTLYNIELSNGGSFPGTGTIETLTYSTLDAVKHNIALRDLDLKQSVALCLVYLAKGYQHKTSSKPDDFMLACAELALQYDPLCLNAMLLKSEVLENRLIGKGNDPARLQTDKDFQAYQAWITKLFTLGYREMSHEMKNLLMKGWTKDSMTVVLSKQHSPKLNNGSVQSTRYASLSWGMFDEEMRTKSVEQYGTALYDTRRREIIGFKPVQAVYNDYNFDPVAFAWNVDPLAHVFPGQSPYSAMNNNPIFFVDPDGRSGVAFWEGQGNKRTLVIKADYHYIEGTIQAGLLNDVKAGFGSFKNVQYEGDNVRARFDVNFIAEKAGTDLSVFNGDNGQNGLFNKQLSDGEYENGNRAEVDIDLHTIATETFANPADPTKSMSLTSSEKYDLAVSSLSHGIGHNLGLIHADGDLMKRQTIYQATSQELDINNHPLQRAYMKYEPNKLSKANVSTLLGRIPDMSNLKNGYWKDNSAAEPREKDNGVTIFSNR